jgi:hypothetical protein
MLVFGKPNCNEAEDNLVALNGPSFVKRSLGGGDSWAISGQSTAPDIILRNWIVADQRSCNHKSSSAIRDFLNRTSDLVL